MKLFYFTLSYPYGIGEQWKTNELQVLRHAFENITVVPYGYAGNFDNPKPLPEGVDCLDPLFRTSDYTVSKKDVLRILFSRHLPVFAGEFLTKRVFLRKDWLLSWFVSTVKALDMLSHPVLKRIVSSMDEETVFYFYWGKGLCDIMPFIRKGRLRKSVVRMHRFDLFEYVNNGYLPYRRRLLESISTAISVSQAGKDHMDGLYPDLAQKIVVMRCGTRDNGRRSPSSTDGKTRIVSCSYLIPVKRVELMIETLALLGSHVEWHHIGDGPLRPELERAASERGVSDRFIFHGLLDSERVLDFYSSNPFDCFVNMSQSEGVPISIMEALSAGIPVLATAVGGTSEIVDESVGRSLRPDVTPMELSETIRQIEAMSPEETRVMRDGCFERYRDRCDAEKLARELTEFLVS